MDAAIIIEPACITVGLCILADVFKSVMGGDENKVCGLLDAAVNITSIDMLWKLVMAIAMSLPSMMDRMFNSLGALAW